MVRVAVIARPRGPGLESAEHVSHSRSSASSAGSLRSDSPPPAQELLDRIVDPFLVTDLGQGQVRLLLERLFELAVELARAIGALDLAVAEEVALGQELVAEQVDALAVVLAPVVAVGEVEDVDVPVDRGMLGRR